jgi:hypothetical protein
MKKQSQLTRQKLTRREFFYDSIGRLLTLCIVMADAIKNDALVDRLLTAKVYLLRRLGK